MRTRDIWAVDLGTPTDPEAGFDHRALIVSAPRFTGPLRLVCPLTSTPRAYPWRIELEPDAGNGLLHTSYVQTEHVRSLSVVRFARRLGRVDDLVWLEVQRVLRLLLDL